MKSVVNENLLIRRKRFHKFFAFDVDLCFLVCYSTGYIKELNE